MKLHFVLLLALKSSHLAAIVFLTFAVRDIYATGNLIVASFEDLSFCGKLQLSFPSPVLDGLSLQRCLSPQFLLLSSGVGSLV